MRRNASFRWTALLVVAVILLTSGRQWCPAVGSDTFMDEETKIQFTDREYNDFPVTISQGRLQRTKS